MKKPQEAPVEPRADSGDVRVDRPGAVRAPADHAGGNPLKRAGRALLGWLWATAIDAVLVGILWFIGLTLLHVPFAPLWAGLGAVLQFIPNIGSMLTLIGPTLSLWFSGGHWAQFGLLLGLYAAIVLIDQLVIMPLLLRRMVRVPIWASIFGPIVLGIIIPFWGVLIAPPLLAVVFAFWRLEAFSGKQEHVRVRKK